MDDAKLIELFKNGGATVDGRDLRALEEQFGCTGLNLIGAVEDAYHDFEGEIPEEFGGQEFAAFVNYRLAF